MRATGVAERLGAQDVGPGGTYHLRGPNGGRIRVAGRRVHGVRSNPRYFALGPTIDGDPFDDLVVVLFDNDWSIVYAYRLPIDAVRRHHKQPGRQGCRLMLADFDRWRGDGRRLDHHE